MARPNQNDFVFGIQSVTELLKSEKDIEKVLVSKENPIPEIERLAKLRNVQLQRVPVERLAKITGKNHQGVIAFVSPINYAELSNIVASTFEKGEVPFVLILDRLTDVRNFGAIARTAESSGVHTVVVPSKGSVLISSDAMKTSSGALSHLPVCRVDDLKDALKELHLSGFKIVCCTEKASDNYFDKEYTGPLAVVMGSEEDGISDELIRISDEIVKIPMMGQIASLNVSVAAGIILFEAVKQRLQTSA